MINYFFLPNSYNAIDFVYIKQSLEGLNEAMAENNANELFYEDFSFYTAECANGQLLYEKLMGTDPTLIKRLLPAMQRRMKHVEEISDDIVVLNANYDRAWANCLWGWFINEDRNHIRSFEFFSHNRKVIAKEVANGMKDSWSLGGGFRLSVLQQEYGMDISDESDTVKNTPRLRQQRYFRISNERGRQYCFFHIKLGNIRVHIYPEEQERVIYVAYIGPHLDLA